MASANLAGWFARLRGAAAADPQKPALHESFLVYRGGFYFKLALILCAVCSLLYLLHDPPEGPSGSTWLGYSLGTLSALLVLWLTWFGVRKRKFITARTPAKTWVSAHVYLGLSLIVVATLHSGFQIGWNVHSLAYVLMLGVIASGLYGIYAYATLPARITATREGQEFRAMIAEIAKLNEAALALAEKIDAETHAVVARSVGRVRIGGNAWEQLTGRYAEPGEEEGGSVDNFIQLKSSQLAAGTARQSGNKKVQMTIAFVADQMFSARGDAAGGSGETLQKLLQAIADRKKLIAKVNSDITLRARLNVWLYLHVPLAVALLAALVVHVFAVYFYW